MDLIFRYMQAYQELFWFFARSSTTGWFNTLGYVGAKSGRIQ